MTTTKPLILSTRPATGAAVHARRALVFDACHAGVVLRAVLFVELVLAVGSLFGASGPRAWLVHWSLLTAACLPATLAWLLAACAAKHGLRRLGDAWQYAAGVALGALAGLMACLLGRPMLDSPAQPPWLASAASGALLAALLVAALMLRARARAPAATAARLSELQARIRPHFLFNALNSAIALVREEPARAETLLEDLSDLFRYALLEQGESATLAEEIAVAQRYLEIEQVRFGSRMCVQWQLDDRAAGARLPPLLLQPLVENAVKHGVEPLAAGQARLRVRTQLRGRRVVLAIDNTVPPALAGDAPRTHGHGIAQANVRERLRLLHDLECTFSAGPGEDGLYHVRLSFPAS